MYALHLKPTPENLRNSEGAFLTLADGAILFFYTRYNGDWGDDAAADIVMRRSEDDGLTWGDEELVISRGDRLNVMSVSLLRLADSRIALCYLVKEKQPGHTHGCRPVIRFSTDEARSWGPEIRVISQDGYYVVNNDRIIQLASGRLIVPAAYHRTRADEHGGLFHDGRAIGLFYLSDDGGQSWRESTDWVLPPHKLGSGLQEPGAVELGGGRVMAWFRTGRFKASEPGFQYRSFSEDNGETWSAAEPAPEFRSPCSPLTLKRDPFSGELFAIWNDQDPRHQLAPAAPESWERTPLVLARSADHGKTWFGHAILESAPDHGYCYTALHFTRDALLLGYCCGGKTTIPLQELAIRRIPRNML